MERWMFFSSFLFGCFLAKGTHTPSPLQPLTSPLSAQGNHLIVFSHLPRITQTSE
jgi:hypothetical protein